jgi:glycolate oxidase
MSRLRRFANYEKANAREFRIASSAAEVDQIWLARRVAFGSVARFPGCPNYGVNDITVPRSTSLKLLPELKRSKRITV